MPNITKEQSKAVSAAMRKANVNRIGIQRYFPHGELSQSYIDAGLAPCCGQCMAPMSKAVYGKAAVVRARGDKPGHFFRCLKCFRRVALYRYHIQTSIEKQFAGVSK
jgi:hypothetical protein